MQRTDRCLHLIALVALLQFIAYAQQPSHYRLSLNKDYISWVWSADFQTAFSAVGNSHVTFNNQLQSSLFRQSAQTDRWRDENTLAFSWRFPLSRNLATRTIVASRIYSDETANRKFNKHLVAQELQWQITPQIAVTPASGMAFEESFNKADQGWYGKLGVSLSRINMGEYINTTEASSQLRAFPGRNNQEHTLYTGWTRQFSSQASDSLKLGYQYSETRYYIQSPAGSAPPIETVYINTRFLSNQLQYLLSEQSVLLITTNFKNRDIDQSLSPENLNLTSRRRVELALENQLEYLIYWQNWRWQNTIFTSQSENDNPSVETDISTLQTAFSTSLERRSNDGRHYWGKLSYTKLEYNTPSLEDVQSPLELRNRQDRDEQRFIFDIGFRHPLRSYFTVGLKGNVYLFHQIYLRSGRSQNNNWNRVYQLAGEFDHQMTDNIRHRQSVKILANYTVFDFEELLPTVRSYVFRKLIYSDSLVVKLSKHLEIFNIYQLEKEDNGSFFKAAFAQKVNRELTAHFFNIGLTHRNVLGLHLSIGFTVFNRNEWGFTADRTRVKLREFESFSPRMTLIFPASRRLLLYVNYAPNRTINKTKGLSESVFSENIQYFTSGNINLRYTF
jgi:hypothetical protein